MQTITYTLPFLPHTNKTLVLSLLQRLDTLSYSAEKLVLLCKEWFYNLSLRRVSVYFRFYITHGHCAQFSVLWWELELDLCVAFITQGLLLGWNSCQSRLSNSSCCSYSGWTRARPCAKSFILSVLIPTPREDCYYLCTCPNARAHWRVHSQCGPYTYLGGLSIF